MIDKFKPSLHVLGMIAFVFVLSCAGVLHAQNNARLFSANGAVFRVLVNDTVVNKIAEANVLLENIKSDTLHLKIVFENNKLCDGVIYLLEKGKKTTNKEYNYKVIQGTEPLKIIYTGVSAIVKLPDPLVPDKTDNE